MRYLSVPFAPVSSTFSGKINIVQTLRKLGVLKRTQSKANSLKSWVHIATSPRDCPQSGAWNFEDREIDVVASS